MKSFKIVLKDKRDQIDRSSFTLVTYSSHLIKSKQKDGDKKYRPRRRGKFAEKSVC